MTVRVKEFNNGIRNVQVTRGRGNLNLYSQYLLPRKKMPILITKIEIIKRELHQYARERKLIFLFVIT